MLCAYLKYQMDLNMMAKKRAVAHNAEFLPSRTLSHSLSHTLTVFARVPCLLRSVIEQNNTPLTTVAAAI